MSKLLDLLVKKAYADVVIGDNFSPAKDFPTIGSLINVLLRNVLTIAGVIAFVIVVIAGLNVISHAGSGDAQQLEKDQKAFTGAIVGLVLIFGAFFIIQLISTILGYNILSPTL